MHDLGDRLLEARGIGVVRHPNLDDTERVGQCVGPRGKEVSNAYAMAGARLIVKIDSKSLHCDMNVPKFQEDHGKC